MQKTKVQKIGVLCYYHFPDGMAPTNRIIAYGKGLYRNGVDVDVIIFRPKLKSDSSPSDGSIFGVKYHYASERPDKSSYFRKLFWDRPVSLFNTINYIQKSHKDRPFDFILLSFDSLRFLFFFIPILRLLGIRLAFIGDEYPIPIREKLKNKLPVWRIFGYKIAFCGIQLRILMTEALKDFFNTKISPKPTHLLSTITDTDRFANIARSYSGPPYLCYMGNMELSKDNVDNIIKAYKLFSDRIPGIELHLYGNPSDSNRSIIETLIETLRLSDKVFLKGRANYEEVPHILANARILVTSQPITKRAEGGFPTKLGEYLMSNRPAIVTNVGEIAHYVKDGETVYIVPPCDPQAYAEKLEFIIRNYSQALAVAERGRDYILNNFSCQQVAASFKQFLESQLRFDKQQYEQ